MAYMGSRKSAVRAEIAHEPQITARRFEQRYSGRLGWFRAVLTQEIDRVEREEAEFKLQEARDAANVYLQEKLRRDERSMRFDEANSASEMGGKQGSFDGAGTGGQD